MPPDLSAVVLGYRAGESLVRVVAPLHELLEQAGIPYELIIVANFWRDRADDTPAIAARFAVDKPRVRVVAEEKQGAMGWDMRTGLREATGDIMVVIDGDSQNPVEDVLKLYELMRSSRAAVGKGRRVHRHDGVYRRLISIVYNVAFQLMFRTRNIWDVNGKPKALTRRAYEALDLHSDDWFIDAEIVLGARELDLPIVELPVTFFRNEERASFVKSSAMLQFSKHMLRRRFRR
ncbi:MAG: glycosyltransferase family 2 protein [Gaiellaceae bacterium]